MNLSNYWKAVIAAGGVVVTTALAAIQDSNVSPEEGGFIATAALVFLGVLFKRNVDKSVKAGNGDIGP